MKAGRELDALIGKEIFDLEFWYGDPTGYNIEENIDYWIVGSESDYSGELNKRCPHYSTRIAAAWLVVEKLREMGAWISISIAPNKTTWDCRGLINEGKENEVRFIDHATTASLTICLAALEAVGHEK